MTRQKREETTYNIEALQAAGSPTANKDPKREKIRRRTK